LPFRPCRPPRSTGGVWYEGHAEIKYQGQKSDLIFRNFRRRVVVRPIQETTERGVNFESVDALTRTRKRQ